MSSQLPAGPAAGLLRVIRASLILTVSAVAVAAVLTRDAEPLEAAYAWVAGAMAAGAVLVALVLRPRAERPPRGAAATLTILGWAVGEGAALLGWILHLMGAPLAWASPGTAAFLVVLALLPIPDDSRP